MSNGEPEALNRIINDELSKLKPGDKVRTIDFVNNVISSLSKGSRLSEDDEARLRPQVVDVLWELQRRGVVKFSDDLLVFEKTQG
ncbi:hypothetical protein [Caldivirga sp.]|uniref:hypothetical protein n=1 Tax=Caldivirga sp. TaxID=2080243 RepID=UPI0025B8E69A|nr:hypothetical protein [Caldivirga sp.]